MRYNMHMAHHELPPNSSSEIEAKNPEDSFREQANEFARNTMKSIQKIRIELAKLSATLPETDQSPELPYDDSDP